MRWITLSLLVGCGRKDDGATDVEGDADADADADSDADADADADADSDADTDTGTPLTWTAAETSAFQVQNQGSGPNFIVASDDGGVFYSAHGADVRVTKYAANGQLDPRWDRTFPIDGFVEPEGARVFAMAPAPGGGLYIGVVGGQFGGWVIERALADASTDWSVELIFDDDAQVSDIALGPTGDLHVLGATTAGSCRVVRLSPDGDQDDTFVVDLDALSAGQELDTCSALTVGPDGSVYVAGHNGSGEPSVRKVTSTGQLVAGGWEMGAWFVSDGVLYTDAVLPGNLVVHDGTVYALYQGRGAYGAGPPPYRSGYELVTSPEAGGALSGQTVVTGCASIGLVDGVLGLLSISDAEFVTDAPPALDFYTSGPIGGTALAHLELTGVPGTITLDPFQVVTATPGGGFVYWTLNGGLGHAAGFTLSSE